jgi:hypothetical protein
MSDRGSQAGSFREDTPAAETEIPLNIPEEEPQTASETKPQPLPEIASIQNKCHAAAHACTVKRVTYLDEFIHICRIPVIHVDSNIFRLP